MVLSDDLDYSFLNEEIVRTEIERLTNKGVDDGLIQYESTPLTRNKKKFLYLALTGRIKELLMYFEVWDSYRYIYSSDNYINLMRFLKTLIDIIRFDANFYYTQGHELYGPEFNIKRYRNV